jgi:phospholipid-translocating ATPase
MKSIVLAIGDGGNDVGMIEEANIGVGIIGKEGNSAASISDFSFGKFKFLDRLLLHHGRWFYFRLSYFFIFYGWKNIILTFMMFIANVQSTFSGILNYSEFFFVLFNSFFAVAQIVYSGFYEQDINDDRHPNIWKYLPEIYKETKAKDLFSFKRYTIWFFTAVFTTFACYFMVVESLNPLSACDASGRVPDQYTERLANGMVLIMVIIVVNYIDTQSHPPAYTWFVFIFASLILSALFFVVENYLPLIGYYETYTDNFNARFYLTVFATISLVGLAKMALSTFYFEMEPSLIDIYKVHMDKNPHILDDISYSRIRDLSSSRRDCLMLEPPSRIHKERNSFEGEMVPVEILSDDSNNLHLSKVYSSNSFMKRESGATGATGGSAFENSSVPLTVKSKPTYIEDIN